jgi:hypothetical protein
MSQSLRIPAPVYTWYSPYSSRGTENSIRKGNFMVDWLNCDHTDDGVDISNVNSHTDSVALVLRIDHTFTAHDYTVPAFLTDESG